MHFYPSADGTIIDGPENLFTFSNGLSFTEYIDKKKFLEESVIGQGAYSSVYRIDVAGESYVLKVVEDAVPNILKEVRTLVKLKGKWFSVQLITASVLKEGVGYILSPWVSGKTLATFQRDSRKLNLVSRRKRYIEIYNQLITATLELHDLGIVHSDIKPQNIWIPDDGPVFFLDFGLSETIGNEKGLVGTSGFLNSRRWTSKGRKIGFEKGVVVSDGVLPVSPNINWYALGSTFNSYDPDDDNKASAFKKVGLTNMEAKKLHYGGRKTRRQIRK